MASSAMAGNPSSWNRYSYTMGDPVNHSDPSGMNEFFDGGLDDGGGDGFDSWYEAGPIFNTGDDGSGPRACQTNPTFALAHPAACGITPVAAPVPPQQPTCSISLEERPVPDTSLHPAFHTYLDVTDSDWTNDPNGVLLEGGPSGNPSFSRLVGFDTQAPGQGLGAGTSNASNPKLPSNFQIGTTYSGGLACGAIQYLTSAIDSYNDSGKLATYNFLALPGTYNSNSFTYTLLQDLNSVAYSSILGSFSQPNQPFGWTPGWGKFVPGF
jgi:hypothetical protein